MMNDYGKGRYSVIHEMIEYVKVEIEKVKERNPQPNTPEQISAGGRLAALNKVLQKLEVKKINTIMKSIPDETSNPS